ncbi:uncharacterized protein TM35_000064310 [Trypanosoma theileri]|uniref:Uncharacterized protein n=1 Tax=Trypanosoma theileri TaxID=67003 RepID=A0A1X0P398_9TRYP|nr:uncharacterized protein TM35_000064310 [Trypanosoma theileri]ORC91426.1 hypothetical protein TM35_000064310 [Trypanosoma theileri]
MECRNNTSSPINRIRYYYEDGRGNKVWVQNLTLDYDVQHSDNGFHSSFVRRCNYKDPFSMSHQRIKSGLEHRTKLPLHNRNYLNSNKVIRKERQIHNDISGSPSRAVTLATRCTCACPIHSGLGNLNVKDSRESSANLEWTFLPNELLEGLIQSVEDAEFILKKLRNEEGILRSSQMY